jgi:hypothetical protein
VDNVNKPMGASDIAVKSSEAITPKIDEVLVGSLAGKVAVDEASIERAANIIDKTNEEIFIFSKKYSIYDVEFWIVVGFEKDNIQYVELENADKDLSNSYSNWSNYKVKLKKDSHDKWLKKLLDVPDIIKDNEVIYNLQWGMVTSYIDPRSGNVCISIRYRY